MSIALIGMVLFILSIIFIVTAIGWLCDECPGTVSLFILLFIIGLLIWIGCAYNQEKVDLDVVPIHEITTQKGCVFQIVIDETTNEIINLTSIFDRILSKNTKIKIQGYKQYNNGINWQNTKKRFYTIEE